jgi:hypothetical protein
MSAFFELLFWLLVGHAIADFAAQSQYMADSKNRHSNPHSKNVWGWILNWHSLIHAGVVAACTGYVWIGMLEYFAHMTIDYLRCEGKLGQGDRGYHVDQVLHILCKVVWTIIALSVASHA